MASAHWAHTATEVECADSRYGQKSTSHESVCVGCTEAHVSHDRKGGEAAQTGAFRILREGF